MFFALSVAFMVAAPPAEANEKYAAMVIDHHTGKVLFARHVDASRYPASLTKIMTLYVLFDEMDAGRVKLSDRITISKHAAGMPPSKLGLKAGSTIRVEDAIRALVTKSANDIAAAVAEHIAGTESAFAKRMTRKARALGMSRTTFRNASGLPNSKQKTTARDMVTMSRAIMTNHPRYYRYFSTRSFRYKGRAYRNHNRLLGSVKGVDGIKTGYTRASGFNLTSSVKRKNRHLVAVVMGGRSGRSRDQHMASLLSQYMSKGVARKSPPRVPPGVQMAAVHIPLPLARPQQPSDAIAAQIALSDTTAVQALTSQQPVTLSTTADAGTPAASAPISIVAERSVAAPSQVPLPPIIIASAQPFPQRQRTPPPAAIRIPIPQEPVGEGDVTTSDDERAEQPLLPSGWAIQIGAVESETEAQALIAKAKSEAATVIASRTPFTEQTVKNGTTYIRARFAGFDTANDAKAACRAMKKNGFGCFPISL